MKNRPHGLNKDPKASSRVFHRPLANPYTKFSHKSIKRTIRMVERYYPLDHNDIIIKLSNGRYMHLNTDYTSKYDVKQIVESMHGKIVARQVYGKWERIQP